MLSFLLFDDNGKLLAVEQRNEAPPVVAGIHYWQTDDPALLADPDQAVPTFGLDGEIESVALSPPETTPRLYVHFSLTGGVISPSGTRYLKNDGVDALTVSAELRDGPDPVTDNLVTQIGGVDITDLWALELVNAETGVIADTPLVQMTAGAINATYKTTIAPCLVRLDDTRFEMIGPYKVLLAAPVDFKVVRELT